MVGLEARDPDRTVTPGPAINIGLHLVAERAQLPPELGLVDLAGESLGTEDPARVHRPPLPILALRHIQDHAVGMELRVEGPACLVPEARRHHHVCRLYLTPAVDPRLGVTLQLG